MKKFIVLGFALFSISSHALDYQELEVYPYETAQPGETEVENATSVSSIFRSSFEVTHGISDRWEIAAYSDFANTATDNTPGYAAFRTHARTRFFEKGELPVDFGAYVEMEFHNPTYDPARVESEFRGIIEKDIGYFTVDFNPIIEQPIAGETGGPELSYAGSLIYRMNHTFRPHFDVFGSIGDENEFLLGPALDVHVARGVTASVNVAFGLTDDTLEKNLAGVRVEYEF